MPKNDSKSVDITTGVGTLSFPHVFSDTVGTNDKGEKEYSIQIIIPKSDKKSLRAIMAAIKEVGEAKWGDKWKAVRTPLRDGDAEKGDLTDDGSTKGEKYPERLGAYFINARSKKPVGVVDRDLTPISDSGRIYGGCKGKISISFYSYSQQGNTGIGAGLNGVQFIADGEPLGGGGKPAVESMFDVLDDDDDLGLDDEVDEVDEKPKKDKKAKAKKKKAKV